MMPPSASELGELEGRKSDPLKPVTTVRYGRQNAVPRERGSIGPGFRTIGCFAVAYGDGLRRRRL
jgi:hypothetical protein